MHSAAVNDAPRVEWAATAFRLIPSRFPPVSIYEGLVANDRVESLVEIENLTNPRLKAAQRIAAMSREMSEDRLQNWNHAPFAYSNPEGSNFFPPDKPCLELAADRQTALAVSIARRQRFLARTAEPAIGLDMRMLATPVSGVFLDFRPLGTELDHTARRALGAAVPPDVDGILFQPPERPAGVCIAVLRGSALGRSVQAVHYRYVWNGQRVVSLYAFDAEGQELSPDALAGTEYVLAA